MCSIRLSLLLVSILGVSACSPSVKPPTKSNPHDLPLGTIFKGDAKFHAIADKAVANHWRELPLGERTVRIAMEMVGTSYENFTLEVDDHIEAPVVNFNGMDCWTFYENALAMARMIQQQPPPYEPVDMLRYVELERYRQGNCDGSYLSRMHHLEEVFYDNQRRGLATNITPQLPGAERIRRDVREMTLMWRSYRYLRANPSLLEPMATIERRVSNLPVYHIPKSKVRSVEGYLRNGDICAITTHDKYGYTSHVGLILMKNGRAHFVHATSSRDKGRRVVVDHPITNYVHELSKHAGIVVCRPKDLPLPQSKGNVQNIASLDDRILNRR